MATRKQKEKRERRYTDAKKRAEEHDSGFQPTSFKVPEGMELFRWKKAGVYRLDIIPFIAGKGNPYAEEGDVHWERTYYVHRGIGAEENSYACLRKTFGKPCPICEHVAKLRADPSSDDKLIQSLREKERQLILVLDHGNRDKGVQILETSHYLSFGEMLDNKIKASDEEDGYTNFFHLEDGMTLKVNVEEDSFAGRTYMKPTNIEMVRRKEPLDDSILDEVPCPDDIITELSYKELKKILLQIPAEAENNGKAIHQSRPAGKPKSSPPPDDEDDEDEDEDLEDEDLEDEDEEETVVKKTPAKKGRKQPTADDFGIKKGMKVIHNEHGECEVVHVSGDGTSLRLEDEEGEVHMGVGPDEVGLVEEKPQPKKSATKPGTSTAAKPSKKTGKPTLKEEEIDEDDDFDDEDDEDEDLDDDEDEEPVAKKPAKKPAGKKK